MKYAVVLIVLALIGFLGILLFWSPGRLPPVLNHSGQPVDGSLSEKVFVEINGSRQGMFIQSANPENPILLFLHGGPGMPAFLLNTSYPSGLEQDFTVVWWEQRGAGLSYSSDIPPSTMTVNQMIDDTIKVADYLRARFHKDKIILLGHSWGGFLGIQVAQRAPDRFSAYVGMGQVVYQLESEIAAHEHLLQVYKAQGDTRMVRRLELASVDRSKGLSDAWMQLRDEAMHKVGVGTTRDMRSVITGIFLPSLKCSAYTLSEKLAIWRGKQRSRQLLWDEVVRTNLAERVQKLEVPAYFFMGSHDYTTNYSLALSYYRKIQAPVKGFYTFHNSAHSPLFEEPAFARKILREDMLNFRILLADPVID